MTDNTNTEAPGGDFDNGDDTPGKEVSLPGAGDNSLELFPPAQRPMMEARVMLREHVGMMADAFMLADSICYTSAVPDRYRGKPKDGAAAIMYGAELGLNPMTSLQKVINVQGTPSLEARSMKGLLKSKGFQFRVTERSETRFRIEAWEPGSSKRHDPPDEVSEWTIDRAQKAEFCPVIDPATGEYRTFKKKSGDMAVLGNMKYITQPTEMLEAKGTAEVCRAIAPEILMGMPYSTEERETEVWADDADRAEEGPTSAPTDRRAKGVSRLRDKAKAARTKREPAPEPIEAEEVALSDDADESGPVTPDQPAADPSPAPPEADATAQPVPDGTPTIVDGPDQPGAGTTTTPSEDLPAPTADKPAGGATPQPAPVDDLAMSPSVRAKGVDMLTALLLNGGIDEEYRWDAVSEVLGKRPESGYRRVESFDAVTNTELKWLVDTLRSWKSGDTLSSWLGEAVNNAALREAGMLEE